MLSVILHYLSGGDQGILSATGSSTEHSGSKRDKANIERKIRKEIGENDHPQYANLRQLIPVPKEQFEIIKFKKVSFLKEKKWRNQGLEVAGKEIVNPWQLIEGASASDISSRDKRKIIDLGSKCPPPLFMSWFGASRTAKLPEEWQYREKRVSTGKGHQIFCREPTSSNTSVIEKTFGKRSSITDECKISRFKR